MMRKMPACPKCGKVGLMVQGLGKTMDIFCNHCKWTHSIQLPKTLDAIDTAITEAVRAAQVPRQPG